MREEGAEGPSFSIGIGMDEVTIVGIERQELGGKRGLARAVRTGDDVTTRMSEFSGHLFPYSAFGLLSGVARRFQRSAGRLGGGLRDSAYSNESGHLFQFKADTHSN